VIRLVGWIKIIELEKMDLKDVILIQGLPGLGFVGKIAVDYMIEVLNPVKIAELYSDYLLLPDGKSGVIINYKGIISLPKYEFYAYKGDRNIIFLAGDTQPVSWAQYTVAEKVIEYASKYGLQMIVTLGGTTSISRKYNVFGVATSEDLANLLKKYGVKLSQGGAVTGACGIMLGLAKLYNIKAFSLLGSITQLYPDVIAAKNVIKVVAEMFNLKIDFTKIDKVIEDMKIKATIAEKLSQLAKIKKEKKEGEAPPRYYM